MPREKAIDIWVSRRFDEVIRDLAYLRLAFSMQDITHGVPSDAIAALTHKLEAEDLRVESLSCRVSNREWLIIKVAA